MSRKCPPSRGIAARRAFSAVGPGRRALSRPERCAELRRHLLRERCARIYLQLTLIFPPCGICPQSRRAEAVVDLPTPGDEELALPPAPQARVVDIVHEVQRGSVCGAVVGGFGRCGCGVRSRRIAATGRRPCAHRRCVGCGSSRLLSGARRRCRYESRPGRPGRPGRVRPVRWDRWLLAFGRAGEAPRCPIDATATGTGIGAGTSRRVRPGSRVSAGQRWPRRPSRGAKCPSSTMSR